MGDLALFEVLAGETFGHLNYSLYQHNGQLDTNSSKVKCPGVSREGGGHGRFCNERTRYIAYLDGLKIGG